LRRLLGLTALLALLAACSDADVAPREPILVTADWLNRSLTVFSQAKLTAAGNRAVEAIIGSVDLSSWAPGPIELEITPDGRTAVVAIGPGFFQTGITNVLIGSPDVPGGSAVLLVDLDSLRVVAEVRTRHAPMGIAITPDGERAYTANYGMSGARGDSVSVIDIAAGILLDEFSVGGRPEQIAIDADGAVGIVNLVDAGGVRLFELADPAGTIGAVAATGNDPSGVRFLSDSTRAIAANSQSTDVTLLDTTDPAAPFALQTTPAEGGVPYGVTYLPGRDSILAPTGVPAALLTFFARGDSLLPASRIALPGEPFPMNAVADQGEAHAFVPHMSTAGDVQLSIVDLDSGEVRGVRWLEASGPSYVASWP